MKRSPRRMRSNEAEVYASSRRVGHDFGGMSLNTCSIGLLRCPASLILQIGLAWQLGEGG